MSLWNTFINEIVNLPGLIDDIKTYSGYSSAMDLKRFVAGEKTACFRVDFTQRHRAAKILQEAGVKVLNKELLLKSMDGALTIEADQGQKAREVLKKNRIDIY